MSRCVAGAATTHRQPSGMPGLKSMAESLGPRRARSRQLHVEERIPVLVVGRDKEVEELDGGNFYLWLMRYEEECAAREAEGLPLLPAEHICVVGSDNKPLPRSLYHRHEGHPGSEHRFPLSTSRPAADVPFAQQPAAGCNGAPEWGASGKKQIHVPSVRSVEGAQGREAQAVPALSSAAYIRYKQPTVDDLDIAVEYDMDDEDEAWLQKFNASARSGGKQAVAYLSEDSLEASLDRLEKEYFYELRRQTRALAGKPEKEHLKSLAPADILPLSIAQQRLPAALHAGISEIYAHWLQKTRDRPSGALGAVQPLIPRLRSEVEPRFLQGAPSSGSLAGMSAADEVPFRGRDPQKQQKVAVSDESFDNMLSQRDDLEVVRILVDQVRRREKLKRQIARNWLSRLREDLGEASQHYASQLEERTAMNSRPKKRSATGVTDAVTSVDAKKSRQAASYPADINYSEKHECGWCGKVGNCVVCRQCELGFCYSCFRSRPGHGVKGWTAAIRNPNYKCQKECAACTDRDASRVPSAMPSVRREEVAACTHTPAGHRATGNHVEQGGGASGNEGHEGRDGQQPLLLGDSDPCLQGSSRERGRSGAASPSPASTCAPVTRGTPQRRAVEEQPPPSSAVTSQTKGSRDLKTDGFVQQSKQGKGVTGARTERAAQSRELRLLLHEPGATAHGAHATAHQILQSGRQTRQGTNIQA